MDSYVYAHIRLDTNEVFYIGISDKSCKSIKNKYKRAYNKISRNNFWFKITNKSEYKVVILHDNICWNEACILEIKLIAFHGRRNLGLGTLTNLTDGGEGIKGYKMSEENIQRTIERQKGKKQSLETIEKRRQSNSGFKHTEETKKKLSLSHLGKTLSQETKDKLSKANKGRIVSEETRLKLSKVWLGRKRNVKSRPHFYKKVDQYDLNMNFIKTFDSITEASLETGILFTSICNNLNNRSKKTRNFIWFYHKDNIVKE